MKVEILKCQSKRGGGVGGVGGMGPNPPSWSTALVLYSTNEKMWLIFELWSIEIFIKVILRTISNSQNSQKLDPWNSCAGYSWTIYVKKLEKQMGTKLLQLHGLILLFKYWLFIMPLKSIAVKHIVNQHQCVPIHCLQTQIMASAAHNVLKVSKNVRYTHTHTYTHAHRHTNTLILHGYCFNR